MILLQREEVVSRRDDDAFIQLTFFDNQSLFVHENSGFFNATKLCKNVKKNLFHFIRLDKYRELEKHFTLLFGTIAFGTREYEYSNAETFSGTYMHPVLLLAVAMWCSPKMYVEAALVVMDYFNNGGETRKRMMKEKLFPKNFDPRETVNEVTYGGCSILIDPITRWFNASKFCTTHGKRLGYFERTDNIKETLSYLTKLLDKKVSYHKDGDKAAPNYGTYYHPIMFVRLASWISVDFYLKAAMITWNHLFGGSDIESNHIEDTNISLDIEDVREMLERDSGLANFDELTKIDTSDASSSVEEITKDPTTSSMAELSKDKEPITGTTIPINTAIVWDEGGDDDYETCSSSCMEVDDPPKSKKMYSEEEMNCMRREWEIKVDRSMRSQMKTQKEKERLEQEKQQMEEERREQIARLHKEKQRVEQEKQRVEQEKQRVEQEKQRVEQEKQEQITRFHEERRVREDELEELRSRLEDLELEYQRERIAKVDQQNTSSASFSSATDIRTQSILCCAEQHGIKRLESVLLVRMRVTDPETNIETMQIYAFRRQFFSLVATVGEHLPNIVEFLCWFVTDNSVQDFNRCKDSIRNNQSARKHITLTQNTISLTRQQQQKQTTAAAAAALDDVVETAKKVMQLAGLLEADVNVLRRLFDNNSSSSSNASQSNDDDDDGGDDSSNDDPRVRAVLERAYRWIRDAYTEYTTKGRRALMHTGRTRRH